jgi:hypothetical protein
MIVNRNIWAAFKDKWNNNVLDLAGSGAPSNGTSGTGVNVKAGPGSVYFDYTNRKPYINIGTAASPIWQLLVQGQVFNVRTRSTVAQVNAGATLLAAITGWKYRLIDAYAISVGGAAGAVTTVDILGTQGASGVKLVAFAQASLTQSTLLRAGASGGTILADGASFVANDEATAITIGKTGASVTTATHIDTQLLYTIEKA